MTPDTLFAPAPPAGPATATVVITEFSAPEMGWWWRIKSPDGKFLASSVGSGVILPTREAAAAHFRAWRAAVGDAAEGGGDE